MKNFIVILFTLLIFFQNAKATDTNSVKYFPLKAGNMYKYLNYHYMGVYDTIYSKITKDTLINGIKYFYFYMFPYITDGWIRVDSVSGNIYKIASGGCNWHPTELLIDSLNANINNKINKCDLNDSNKYCDAISNLTLFGIQTQIKSFYETIPSIPYSSAKQNKYARNFGLYYSYFSSYHYWSIVNLIGCMINGVRYGNTYGLTGINDLTNRIVTQFILYQNYPNPFNPITKISYELPKDSKVSLIIYDILGKEIRRLVDNEFKQAGIYSIDFNEPSLASGIYFYRITAFNFRGENNFEQVKKMIYIK